MDAAALKLAGLMAQSPATESAALPALEGAPDYHWEGVFEFDVGGDAEDNFRIKAMIGFHGDVVEGSGVLDLLTGDAGGEIGLTGTRLGENVHFEMWYDSAEARSPFVCVGALSADEQAMDGSWTFACFDPENCGCDGGAGAFRLRRVRD